MELLIMNLNRITLEQIRDRDSYILEIVNLFKDNTGISIRKSSELLGISRKRIMRILKDEKVGQI